MQTKSIFSVVRVDFSKVSEQNRVYLRGSLTRFVSANYGRVMCSEDSGFFFCDLPGQKVELLRHICEVSGAVTTTRLVTSAFFDKLFSGEVVG